MTRGTSRRTGSRASAAQPAGEIALALVLVALCAGGTACSKAQTQPEDSGVPEAATQDGGLSVGSPLPLDAGDGHFQGQLLMMLEESDQLETHAPDELPPMERFTFSARGDAYRWDIFDRSQPRGDFRVYDRSAHRFYTVLQSQSVIFSTPESSHLVHDPNASFVLEDLQKKGRVANEVCELYRTSNGPLRYDICATDRFTTFPFHMMPGLLGQTIPFGAELVTRGLFPLLVRVYDTSIDSGAPLQAPGKNFKLRPIEHALRKFEVVLVDPKVIDPTVFELPKYTVQRTDFLQAQSKKVR